MKFGSNETLIRQNPDERLDTTEVGRWYPELYLFEMALLSACGFCSASLWFTAGISLDFVKGHFRQKPEVGLAQSNRIALNIRTDGSGLSLMPLSSRKTPSFCRLELHGTLNSFSALPSCLPSGDQISSQGQPWPARSARAVCKNA